MRFYMIMPVGSDKLFSEKRAIIQSEAQKGDFAVHFPVYERLDKHFDLTSTIQNLRDSEFVIADLSLERPSCYFELGLAQALGKRCVLIAEGGTPIHQANGRNKIKLYKNLEEYRRIISRILINMNIRKS